MMCVEGGWSGVRKKRWGGHHNQTMLNLPLSQRHLMNVSSFCLDVGRSAVWGALCPWDLSYCTWWQPGEDTPLSLVTGLEREATRTFMHKCLLHALNGCGPDGFLLLMHYQWDLLSASQPRPRQKGLYHLFPSSVPLSTKNQWKFKEMPQGAARRHWGGFVCSAIWKVQIITWESTWRAQTSTQAKCPIRQS